jgi:outer membrane receptor protein involved in Fe transport
MKRRTWAVRAGASLAAMMAASAAADVPADRPGIEEIVVTAQKRPQQAIEVPIALTAYTGADLERLGVRELNRLADFVPGLQVLLQGPNNPGFVIRGITSDITAANIEPRVSVFYDGLSISRPQGATVELYDLERVEVLKGPQGTLFGRPAEIGAISIVTAKPTDEVEASGRVRFGNYNERLAEAAVNAPLGDKAAVRVAGIYRRRDGYVDNGVPDAEALNGAAVGAFRVSGRLTPSDGLEVLASLNYQHDDYTGTAFRSGRYVQPGAGPNAWDAAALNRGKALGTRRDLWQGLLQAKWEVSPALALTSLSGFREFNSHEELDADGTPAYAAEMANKGYGRQFSQELRANFSLGERFTGFAGASFQWEDGHQGFTLRTDERSLFALMTPFLAGRGVPTLPLLGPDGQPFLAFPAALGGGVVNPLNGRPFQTLHQEVSTNYGTTRAYELFADGTYRLTDSIDLTAGLRATLEDVNAGLRVTPDSTPGTLGAVLGVTPNDIYAQTRGKETRGAIFRSIVGRAMASWHPTDTLNFYAGVSRGRRPAAINVNAGLSQIVPSEIVWSYEGGAKASLLDSRLAFEAAGFAYTYKNFQTLVVNPAPPPFLLPVNAGNATSYGFEGRVQGKPTDDLTLFATYTWLHARFDDTDASGRPQLYAGHRFRLTPDHTVTLGGHWEVPLGEAMHGFITPSFTYKTRVYFEDTNDPALQQGAYGIANLRFGVEAADRRWAVTAYIDNVTNRRYLVDAGNIGEFFGIPTFIAGPPRFFGVELSGRF